MNSSVTRADRGSNDPRRLHAPVAGLLVLATLLGATLAVASPQSDEPTFTRTFLKRDRLCFESPVELDWEAMARRELKGFPIDRPSMAEIRKQKWEWGVIFSADLPNALEGLQFHLVTEMGVQPIVPESLQGVVRYNLLKPDDPKLEGFHGQVCLAIPEDVREAGFVATSRVPLTWQKTPATLVRSGATTMVRLQQGASSLPPPRYDKTAIVIKSASILSSTALSTRYLFVRRLGDPDSVPCEFIYDIYRWEPGLPVVESNSYGCDV